MWEIKTFFNNIRKIYFISKRIGRVWLSGELKAEKSETSNQFRSMAWSNGYVACNFELRRSRLLTTADLSGAHGCEKKHKGSLKTPADFLKLLKNTVVKIRQINGAEQ